MKVMRYESKKSQNEKKKRVLQLEKKVFSLLLFFGWSFGFAFHR